MLSNETFSALISESFDRTCMIFQVLVLQSSYRLKGLEFCVLKEHKSLSFCHEVGRCWNRTSYQIGKTYVLAWFRQVVEVVHQSVLELLFSSFRRASPSRNQSSFPCLAWKSLGLKLVPIQLEAQLLKLRFNPSGLSDSCLSRGKYCAINKNKNQCRYNLKHEFCN